MQMSPCLTLTSMLSPDGWHLLTALLTTLGVVTWFLPALSCLVPQAPSSPLNRGGAQNHRMVGVGRGLWRSSSPIPLLKHGHLEQAAEDLVQVGFEYLRRRRPLNPFGQPVPVLRHPQREEVLPRVQMEILMLQFVPVAPCPVAGHH